MSTPRSDDYYRRRAEEERMASERATDERAARSHRGLAEEYRKRATNVGTGVPEEPRGGTLAKEFQIVP
jgi:hypothetical protein